ncbi:MAG: HAD family hydrolase [Deltaproteobacteria bacterium]|nr:MAG: HAD family hydrolase [Deltaproteobacteria bacterium]
MLLVVDLDGTLVDSLDDIRFGIRAALAAIGIAATDDLIDLCRRGVGLEVFYRRATGHAPGAADQRARFDRFVAAYRDAYAASPHDTRAYDGVADTLAALRARHPRLAVAVATAKRTAMARQVIDSVGLAPLVDAVVGSDGLPAKPDPAIVRRAAAAVRRPLAGAVMVGDTDRDVGAARAAGCVACAVTYGGWTRDELAALAPDYLLDRFADLLDVAALA